VPVAAALSILLISVVEARVVRAEDAGATASEASESGVAHPSKAVCRVCLVRGKEHGLEDVVAWREYEGQTYFFCSDACRDAFDADPGAYIIPAGPRPAPDVMFRFLDGTQASLSSMIGEVVLVGFWSTGCKLCLESMPEIQKLHNELSACGFRAIGVCIDERDDEKVREAVRTNNFTYPIAIDHEVAPAWEAFHIPTVPAMYLVGRDGMIEKQWVGKVSLDEVREFTRIAVAEKTAE
jgi:peroxiredoxin